LKATSQQRRREYVEALEAFSAGAGEEALTRAYELGRQALADGVGILELVGLHHEALAGMLESGSAAEAVASIRAAEAFLIESLSAFEMSQRAVGEANMILRRLNRMLEEEAGRIAHALHDEAGGILATARMELDLASRGQPRGVSERLRQVRELLDRTGERLRHLSHELRPTILDNLGLKPALEYLAEGVSGRTGINIAIEGELRERPSAAVELAVYRVAQEAINNAVRHGERVSALSLRLEERQDRLRCLIEDDGGGFDVEAALSDTSDAGLGLLGMRERLHAVGGTLGIDSMPGRGTTIEISVPMGK
jgi:signal transduction histidine kinase